MKSVILSSEEIVSFNCFSTLNDIMKDENKMENWKLCASKALNKTNPEAYEQLKEFAKLMGPNGEHRWDYLEFETTETECKAIVYINGKVYTLINAYQKSKPVDFSQQYLEWLDIKDGVVYETPFYRKVIRVWDLDTTLNSVLTTIERYNTQFGPNSKELIKAYYIFEEERSKK